MSTTHSDQRPAAAPVEWRAAPPISTEPGAPDTGTGYPPAGAPAAPAAASRTKRGTVAAGVAALLIAVGGTAGYLVSHASAASSGTSATAQQGAPGGVGGAGTAGGTDGAGGLGFQPTDYHLDGTITAIGNGTVTITASSGTATTYTVTSSTHLMDNGSMVPLSSFTVGESVRGSTTTQGGTTLNDMVGGAGTGARGGTPPQGTTGTGATG